VNVAESSAAARERTLEEIRGGERFLLVTHEHPDGDALGSLIAMHGVLTALGKDAVMFMAADELPLPHEYSFFRVDGMVSTVPEDLDERVVVFLDCGNIDRTPVADLKREGSHILNIDHHHDNTRFGDVDLVVPEASCTAEIVWDLMGELGVRPTPEIAEALYVGLVTDTGKFMYENTGPRAHIMAADLISAGVDVHDVYRRLYEGTPYAKLELLGRALGRVQRFDDGRLTLALLSRDDFRLAGADDSHSEGVIDHLRAVEGTKVAALARERVDGAAEGAKKVSLRSTDGEVDVSAIARAGGGGGHRQAAGFTTTLGEEALVAFLRREVAAQLG
jgi:bifunctional oligoribonuclease and PAP phosphatase NrnA